MGSKSIRIALMGTGTIGRELLRRTSGHAEFTYVAVGDSSGFLAKREGFTEAELAAIQKHKSGGKFLEAFDERLYVGRDVLDILRDYGVSVLVDATAAQTYNILRAALEMAHVVTSNKLPFADVPYTDYRRLVDKAEEGRHRLDYGTTVGAGLKMPEFARSLGVDGVVSFSGCLSGTMNYVSQRINEGTPMSKAVREAMSPPRNYTEPDPRIDLAGEDFRRKLVILARLFGKRIGVRNIAVESLVPNEQMGIGKDEFLTCLPELDAGVSAKVEVAKKKDRALWFLGNMNLMEDEYRLGFHEIPFSDPMAQSKESDNVLRIQPRLWRRPVTLIGPGAGAAETVTGLISGLASVRNSS